ncbi:MAG: NUDIX domain-containing protein [Candidatus Promineifilaceae bacterium]|nr:NUDIX domain-containing protein [Candidatus Promineifilaceae bacterium]
MQLGAEAVVTNEYNEALFVLRNDSRTWAMPGGGVEADERPDEAAAREAQEESGLKVLPVRLVALYYRREEPDGHLLFSFRCLQKGGQLAASAESPRVGFMKTVPTPRPMLALHRERLERALSHTGGPPYWGVQELSRPVRLARWLAHRSLNLRRLLRRDPTYEPAPEWSVGASVLIHDEERRVLWLKRTDHEVWNLPGGGRQGQEAPWETAVRETREETGLDVRLTDLAGVYTKPQQGEVVLLFTAEVVGGTLRRGPEAVDFTYLLPGEEPANTVPEHVERVAGATGARSGTIFRAQTAPPSDLAALAQEG